MKRFLLLACWAAAPAWAATVTVTDNVVSVIPDGDSSGLSRNLVVTTAPDQIVLSAELEISLSAPAGQSSYLGDLYLHLTNGTQIVILTNRAGRMSGNSGGYDDNQSVNVTFTQTAANDFHNYRIPVTGAHATPLTGTLTGNWQPDGRAVDPASVLDTSPRTAGLNALLAAPASGNWTLFAADMSSGGQHQINSWTLRLETIPEPSTALLAAAATLAGLARHRRKGRLV